MREALLPTQVVRVVTALVLTTCLASPGGAEPTRRQLVTRVLPRDARVVARGVPLKAGAGSGSADASVGPAIARLLASARGAPGATAREGGPAVAAPRMIRGERGWLRSVGAPTGAVFGVPGAPGPGDPDELAARFLREHADAFGIAAPGVEFVADRVAERAGRRAVRLGQRVRGLPVFGAAVIVQLGAGGGGVEFVLADVAHDDAGLHRPDFTIESRVAMDAAAAVALTVPERAERANDLVASEPRLMLYEPAVVGNEGASRLVWQLEVTSAIAAVDEVVLVDALTADVAFHYSRVTDTRNREIYDCDNVVGSLGSLARSEGESDTGVVDVDQAYAYLGDTYDFLASHFDRDSIDGAGMTLVARVRYCHPDYPCPFVNAFWDGSEMRFGEGFAAADDVVGHELIHGVTQYESNLIYWSEAGAINESLSDIFGEFIDLENGAGADAEDLRWLIGEDLPIGEIRNMADPTSSPGTPQPDRRSNPNWYQGDEDQRGVHVNSGVGNKLAYLLVDGDTFNGHVVEGLGIARVAALFYEAQTNLLVPAADYYDLYAALAQAAVNLDWTPEERASLERACRAVEIAVSGDIGTAFGVEGFEGEFPPAGWTVYDLLETGTNWGQSTHRASSGSASAWCAAGDPLPQPPGGTYVPDMFTWLIYGPFTLTGAAQAWLELDLWMEVEAWYDGVYVAVSGDGEEFWGFLATAPPTGFTDGWVPDVLNLRDVFGYAGPLNGTGYWIAFVFVSDYDYEFEGVYIDNVVLRTTSCAGPGTAELTAPATAVSGTDYTVSWSATSPLNTYELQESTDSEFTSPTTFSLSGTSRDFSHTVASNTTYYYRVRATDSCFGSTYNSDWSETGQTTVTVGACGLELTDQTVSTTVVHAVCGTIHVGPALAVVSPGDLTLRAGVSVVLRNGVSIDSGATLTIAVDPGLGGP
jgi:Zn-dependent metalloprotease